MPKKSNTKQNPVAVDEETQARKEYLIKRFENNKLTIKEMDEFLSIPRQTFTIEEIARTQRIEPNVYKELMALDPNNGRYVYLNKDTLEYEQTNKLYSDKELNFNETSIDLKSKYGFVVGSLGGLVE